MSPVRGLALPSWLVGVCAALVALALVGFVVTGERDAEVAAAPTADETSAQSRDRPADRTGSDQTSQQKQKKEKDKSDRHKRPVDRSAYVDVYNNSGITGLADSTSAALQGAGWQVAVTDNWYGEIPANTVYYPPQLRAQARLLADDIGFDRLHPAVAPMNTGRLTVILATAP